MVLLLDSSTFNTGCREPETSAVRHRDCYKYGDGRLAEHVLAFPQLAWLALSQFRFSLELFNVCGDSVSISVPPPWRVWDG